MPELVPQIRWKVVLEACPGVEHNQAHALLDALVHPVHDLVRHLMMGHVPSNCNQHIGVVQHFLGQAVFRLLQGGGAPPCPRLKKSGAMHPWMPLGCHLYFRNRTAGTVPHTVTELPLFSLSFRLYFTVLFSLNLFYRVNTPKIIYKISTIHILFI